jgi:hypothetical protein
VTAHSTKQSRKAWRIVVVIVVGGGFAVVVVLLLLWCCYCCCCCLGEGRRGTALTSTPYKGDLKCERGEHGNRGSLVGCMEMYGIRGGCME